MQTNNKLDVEFYVLVCNESDSDTLYYYKGYSIQSRVPTIWIPANTNNCAMAMKLAFHDEAEILCENLNLHTKSFQYHVEAHSY